MRKKILYVDDVSHNLITMNMRLKKHFDIFPAKNSETMFEILETTIPDLILLDINMPKSSGLSVLERLKATDKYAHIPVVFLTIGGSKSNLLRGMNLGAADYMLKSWRDEKILECINLHLEPERQEKPIILAIDDDPSILKSVNFALKDRCETRTLTEPEKMQDLLSIITPDLFLIDCHMPDINGFDLIPKIRAFPQHEHTPILFFSSAGTYDNVSAALTLGAEDFIRKPIDPDILRARIEAKLKHYLFIRRLRTYEKDII
ncbi:MAG: response regulator [Defluviitaleaceae bacterium]|nr:response regulator [Defluviitaleaceae bacterium]MCL2264278.1 response regulator [Defluviitaleaceae bacterium]